MKHKDRQMKQLIITLTLLFSLTFNLFSQTDSVYTGERPKSTKAMKEKNEEWKKKVTYDANFQLFFGTVTYFYITPSIGYIPFKNCNIGFGGIYNYTSISYSGYGRFTQSMFGMHSYLRYSITPNFFVQGQFDKLYQPDWFSTVDPRPRVWVDYGLAGIGYCQPVGNLFSFNTSLMYNLTPQKLSIYPSPIIIQFGFTGRFK